MQVRSIKSNSSFQEKHTTSQIAKQVGTYFASAVLNAMQDCFLLNQEITADPILKQDPEVIFHYYISTKNLTAVLSDFRHFPVACTTLWFFLSIGGLSLVIRHLFNPSIKRQLSLPSVKCKSSVIQHLQVVASTAWPSVLHLQVSLNRRSMKT